jgi:hypothetical protein
MAPSWVGLLLSSPIDAYELPRPSRQQHNDRKSPTKAEAEGNLFVVIHHLLTA